MQQQPAARSVVPLSAFRVFASGLRNPNGLTFESKRGVRRAVVNERDEIGPDLVPEYVTSVKDGAFYGWPYSYYGQHVDPRVQPQRPDLVGKAVLPDYALSSHVAPLGLVFYTGTSFPEFYHGGAFVGEHGRWNGQDLKRWSSCPSTMASQSPGCGDGIRDSDNQARGRPVGLAIDKSGALLIVDDVGNTVWRVSSAHQQVTQGTTQ